MALVGESDFDPAEVRWQIPGGVGEARIVGAGTKTRKRDGPGATDRTVNSVDSMLPRGRDRGYGFDFKAPYDVRAAIDRIWESAGV